MLKWTIESKREREHKEREMETNQKWARKPLWFAVINIQSSLFKYSWMSFDAFTHISSVYFCSALKTKTFSSFFFFCLYERHIITKYLFRYARLTFTTIPNFVRKTSPLLAFQQLLEPSCLVEIISTHTSPLRSVFFRRFSHKKPTLGTARFVYSQYNLETYLPFQKIARQKLRSILAA